MSIVNVSSQVASKPLPVTQRSNNQNSLPAAQGADFKLSSDNTSAAIKSLQDLPSGLIKDSINKNPEEFGRGVVKALAERMREAKGSPDAPLSKEDLEKIRQKAEAIGKALYNH